jgi:ubiquinone biosynthesis protein
VDPTGALAVATVVEVLLRIAAASAIAFVTTAVSLRLLGIRRGWSSALIAGLVGWGTGALLALALAGWDWSTDDLVVTMLAIGIPATMGVAVMLDLLARPGSLARGENAGLLVAPRPFKTIRTRTAVFLRYRELMRIARSEGFGPFVSARTRAEISEETIGIRLRRVLEQAGGVYVKLGQIAATRVDLIPPEICSELAELQNRVEPESTELMKPAVEQEIGGDVSSVFAEFDWTPLAAASIGQTYRARLHTGESVVVKVQRPGIDKVMQRDLAALTMLADFAQRNTALGQNLRTGELLEEFSRGLREELDFRHEADAMLEMTSVLGERNAVRVPKVYRSMCTRRLLVQEHFEGSTLADPDTLDAPGVDRRRLGEQLIRCELEQILQAGFFHADPHPGNVFVLDDGALGLIDFGAVGRLDPIQQDAVRDMLGALMTRDVGLLRDGIERVADITEKVTPDQLERALARFVAENVRASGAVAPTAFQDLVALLASTGIHLPGDLVILSRSLVTLDGTLRVISPDLNLVQTASSVMASTTEPPIIDRDELMRQELVAVLPQLRRLPDRVDRVLSLAGRGDLRVRTVIDEDGQRILRTIANRALLAIVGTAFLVVAAMLLTSGDPGPEVSGGTGLFEIFGYLGLLTGVILLLRVVAAVARDGTT